MTERLSLSLFMLQLELGSSLFIGDGIRSPPFKVAPVVKNPPASAGNTRDEGLIPGSERSTGVGNGNPHQYSCLGNPMDRGAWWAAVCGVAKSWTRMSTHALPYHHPLGLEQGSGGPWSRSESIHGRETTLIGLISYLRPKMSMLWLLVLLEKPFVPHWQL